MELGRINFGPVYPNALGFERILNNIENIMSRETKGSSTFPPHNIVKETDNKYRIELAVAGFSKSELEVTIEQNNLIVYGSKADKQSPNDYIYHGIATRSFTKTFLLADDVVVGKTQLKDGILSVDFERVVPESRKPRKLAIETEAQASEPQLLKG